MKKTTYTLAEAAQLLSCHKETLRRAIQAGELQAARLGREYRISRRDLQTFWSAQGGGELFPSSEQGAPQVLAAQVDEKQSSVEKKKAKKSPGPQQLTLPT